MPPACHTFSLPGASSHHTLRRKNREYFYEFAMVSRKQQDSGRKTTSVHTPEDSMTQSENEVCQHYVNIHV